MYPAQVKKKKEAKTLDHSSSLFSFCLPLNVWRLCGGTPLCLATFSLRGAEQGALPLSLLDTHTHTHAREAHPLVLDASTPGQGYAVSVSVISLMASSDKRSAMIAPLTERARATMMYR